MSPSQFQRSKEAPLLHSLLKENEVLPQILVGRDSLSPKTCLQGIDSSHSRWEVEAEIFYPLWRSLTLNDSKLCKCLLMGTPLLGDQ